MLSNRLVLAIAGALLSALLAGCTAEETEADTPDISAQSRSGVDILPQMGHSNSVDAVAISPDGRLAVSVGLERAVKLWDVATGRELRSFIGHTAHVKAVAFSPDGRFILSGGNDLGTGHSMRMWDVATGRQVRSFDCPGVTSLAFSPDGHFILSGHWDWKRPMKLWDARTGQELRTFVEHPGGITSVAFSPDGRFALSGSAGLSRGDNSMKLWNVATGAELRRFSGDGGGISSVAFSPDGRFALSGVKGRDTYDLGSEEIVRMWRLETGEELRSFDGDLRGISSVAFSPDGRFVIAGGDGKYYGAAGGSAAAISLWDASTGKRLRGFNPSPLALVASVAFSPDGRFILSGNGDGILRLWDAASGREVRSFKGRTLPILSVAFSPDGRFALTGSKDERAHLWDTASGKHLRTFGMDSYIYGVAFSADSRFAIAATGSTLKMWDVATGQEQPGSENRIKSNGHMAFSPDSRLAVTDDYNGISRLWDVATHQQLRSFESGNSTSYAFSPDGRFVLTGAISELMELWDATTGKQVRSFETRNKVGMAGCNAVAFSPDGRLALCGHDKTLTLWEAGTGKKLRSFTDNRFISVSRVAFSTDGRFVLGHGGLNHVMVLWDAATGQKLRSFKEHASWVTSVAFSPDGRLLLSGSNDGTTRIWNVASGAEIARMMSSPEGDWLTVTRDGFFSSSQRDTDMLTIARGIEVTTIGQVHQSLFNPDLVREALAGDPDGEVARAAKVASLDKVLDAGSPPSVAITSHWPGSRSPTDLVALAARITDRGKGVGRIEWRVNGVTAGVSAIAAGTGPEHDVKRTLALDPGENQIEVIAYEGRNLLASLPARTTINVKGSADAVKPKLHILAIGINAYVDKGGAPSSTFGRFPPLSLAVTDAKTFAAEMRKAGAGQYGEVLVAEALDADAAVASLDRIIEQMSARINPRDTFVLFAAAHGISKDGRFYLIPQDYQGGNDPEALAGRAIGQERLQDWVGNRIKARKAVIFLDTCESGALVSGYAKSRTDAPASEAAIGRLHEATGRPVLTAAASGKPAYEGYKGHGVFTFALLDGLRRGDSNGNGGIELSELVAHVQSQVPKFSAELGGRGASTIVIRGFKDDKQSVHFGSTGEDFALVRRLP